MEKNNFVSLVWQERRVPNGVLTDQFVQRFDRYVNWPLLSLNYGLDMPVDMIRIYQHRLIWTTLLRVRLFTESLLREFSPNFDSDCWEVLSKYQRLSEDFIHDYADKVDWGFVEKYQTVSQSFLTRHNKYMLPDQEHETVDSV